MLSLGNLSHFAAVLREASETQIAADTSLGGKLTLAQSSALTVNYAPFEHVQAEAKLVIVGITPGEQQARNALLEARRELLRGASNEIALERAKVFASFSGAMRNNLVEMLDFVGLNKWLGVSSTSQVWNVRSDLVHFTSALRNPVFLRGTNYAGNPSITATPLLKQMLDTWLKEEARQIPDAVWVPLGPVAAGALSWLTRQGALSANRVLLGLPHPSGANAERIAYFVKRKAREALSSKTSPTVLDAARENIMAQVSALA